MEAKDRKGRKREGIGNEGRKEQGKEKQRGKLSIPDSQSFCSLCYFC